LLVLKGAESRLKEFKFIKAEAADFEAYRGCCRVQDLNDFLKIFGFRLAVQSRFEKKQGVGAYYELVYESERAGAKIP
jgi:hypothetical protein